MAGEDKKLFKVEAGSDLGGLISALSQKPLKKKVPIPKGEVDEADTPLASAKKPKAKPSNLSKVKKEEPEYDEIDNKFLKKKEGVKKRSSDSSKTKKEGDEEEEDENFTEMLKKEGMKKKSSNTIKVEKEEPGDDEAKEDLKKNMNLKKNSKTKSGKKEFLVDSDEDEEDAKCKKRKRKEDKSIIAKVNKVTISQTKVKDNKKIKKMYDLPGQKHDPPEMRDPLRIFYETLYEKVPTSEMAAIWMMEWGLLPEEQAQKVYDNKLRKNHNQKASAPAKKISRVSVKKENVISKIEAKTINRKKKKASTSSDEDGGDEDDDFAPIKSGSKKKTSG